MKAPYLAPELLVVSAAAAALASPRGAPTPAATRAWSHHPLTEPAPLRLASRACPSPRIEDA